MKNFTVIPFACALFFMSSGYSEEEKGGPSDVVDEVSEEAAILRALVEEYKAKAAKNAPLIPAPEIAVEKDSSEIPAVEEVPVEFKPRISAPIAPQADPQSLSALAEEIRQVVQSETPLDEITTPGVPAPATRPARSNIPAPEVPRTPQFVEEMTPDVAVKVEEAPKVDRSIIPSLEPPAPPQIVEKMASDVAAKTEGISKAAEPITSVSDLISNPIEPVNSVIEEATANAESVPDMKSAIADGDSIIIKDAPPRAPEISSIPMIEAPLKVTTEIPVIEEMKPAASPATEEIKKVDVAELGNAIKKSTVDSAEKVAATAELEGSVMKSPEKRIPTETAPEVAKAAEMKNAVEVEKTSPELASSAAPTRKSPAPTRTTPVKETDTPLVIATKRPTPENETGNPTTGEVALAATEPDAETPDGPAATAKSITPLKDLGRMIFGPKDTAPRGTIFKRKPSGTALR